MWEQKKKPMGNEDSEKETADYLTRYKTEEREGRGRKGGQKRSKSRNQPVQRAMLNLTATSPLAWKTSMARGYKLCIGVVAGMQ